MTPPPIEGPAGGGRVEDDNFVRAVASVRPMVRSLLATRSWSSRLEDVMASVSSDLWESLDRWERAGSPDLGAWANGVAKNTVRMWLRKERPNRAPGPAPMAFLDAMPTDLPEIDTTDDDDVAEASARIVDAIKTRILAQPGGAARWEQLVRGAHRGSVPARLALQDELAQLAARPSASKEA